MVDTSVGSPPLALPTADLSNIKIPFEGDLLRRRKLADQLTSYLGRLRCGAVIAIDAPWGEGKSWFARNWAAQLRTQHYRVGFIDAFQEDYTEDPFMLLASEIRELSHGNGLAKTLTDKAAAVGSVLLPMMAKATVNGLGKLVGTTDLADLVHDEYDKALDKGADLVQEWTKKRLESHAAEKNSVAGFRRALAEFTADGDLPTVVFIDELDRCRPAFAVRMIERIKHFFEVPNLVFVLIMNRPQLETAIRGVYGAETDAAAYLGKFLHLSLQLPRDRSTAVDGSSPVGAFVRATLQRYQPVELDEHASHLPAALTALAICANVSPRQIERACALYFLSGLQWHGLILFLAVIKIKAPKAFDAMRSGSAEGNTEFVKVASGWFDSVHATHGSGALSRFAAIFRAYALSISGNGNSNLGQILQDGTSVLYGGDHLALVDIHMNHGRAIRSLDIDVQ